jgi:hypothetical protein
MSNSEWKHFLGFYHAKEEEDISGAEVERLH